MAEAVNYTLSQWDALTVFTTDGAVPQIIMLKNGR